MVFTKPFTGNHIKLSATAKTGNKPAIWRKFGGTKTAAFGNAAY
jgi:hypothetical protein